jgi:FMN phosphatase YigB (HAD superfamily)
VGDTPEMDIVGANRVGMRSVLIVEPTTPGLPRGALIGDAAPDHTIHAFAELPAIVGVRPQRVRQPVR